MDFVKIHNIAISICSHNMGFESTVSVDYIIHVKRGSWNKYDPLLYTSCNLLAKDNWMRHINLSFIIIIAISVALI